MVKRGQGGRRHWYKLCVRFKKSQNWMLLPGFPDYPDLKSAEEKLDHLAQLNRWSLCTTQGIKKKRE